MVATTICIDGRSNAAAVGVTRAGESLSMRIFSGTDTFDNLSTGARFGLILIDWSNVHLLLSAAFRGWHNLRFRQRFGASLRPKIDISLVAGIMIINGAFVDKIKEMAIRRSSLSVIEDRLVRDSDIEYLLEDTGSFTCRDSKGDMECQG